MNGLICLVQVVPTVRFQVYIQYVKLLNVNSVCASDDISVLQAAIEVKTGFPRESSWLSFQGRKLVIGRSLASYGISSGSTVHLLVRGNGGGCVHGVAKVGTEVVTSRTRGVHTSEGESRADVALLQRKAPATPPQLLGPTVQKAEVPMVQQIEEIAGPDAFEGEEELRSWLTAHSMMTESVDSAAMRVLLEEHRCGATELRLRGGKPFRISRVVKVRVLSDDGRRTLVCTHRTMADGRRKEVRQPLSAKVHVGFMEQEVAQRCANEQLHIEVNLLSASRKERISTETKANVVPGLACQFIVITFDATVEKGRLPQRDFTTDCAEMGQGMRNHWSWEWRLELPNGECMQRQPAKKILLTLFLPLTHDVGTVKTCLVRCPAAKT